MRSDKQQAPESYLHRVLADGAKPFRYRSGVRSLMGILGGEGGNLEFSPTLPPVGFRFIDHPFMGEPYVAQYSPPNEASSFALHNDQGSELEGSREFAREDIGQNVPIEETRIEIPDTSEKSQYNNVEKELGQDRLLIKDTARHNGAVPESMEKNISAQLTEKTLKPDVVIKKARIEIPGASEKKKSFPPLPPTKKGGTTSGKTEDRSQQEVSPADSRQDFVSRPSFKTQESKPLINSTINTGYTSEKLQRKTIVQKRHDPKPLSGLENQVTGGSEAVTGDPEFGIGYRLSSGRSGADTVNRSSVDAGERIEQLRHAVHDLIVKKSVQQGRSHDETQPHQPEQTQAPPPQQIVIIKRPSSLAKTSCAFWERSYLGRFHLRPLR